MRKVQHHVASTYFVLTGYRHCSELGRIVLNRRIPMGLVILECDVNVLIG